MEYNSLSKTEAIYTLVITVFSCKDGNITSNCLKWPQIVENPTGK